VSPKETSNELERGSIVRIPTDAGMRFDLCEDDFDRWMGALPEEDFTAFIFHGGDRILAKFLFAYDYLTHVEAQPTNVATVVRAYAAASGLDATAPETRARASRAWEHDAVKELLDRFASRGMKAMKLRVWLRYSNLVEKIIDDAEKDDATAKDKRMAAGVGKAFMEMINKVEEKEQKLRTDRAIKGAMDRLGSEDEFEAPAEAELAGYVEQLAKEFGSERIIAIASRANEQTSSSVSPQ
jgi:hypothetical protein